jgi:osmotically-inducible protein OsmY
MTTLLTQADHDIQVAVRAELDASPELLDPPAIAVGVVRGTVNLSGQVDSNAERLAAKHAALRVRGVGAVVDDIEVASSVWDFTEADVAAAVERALHWAADVPSGIRCSLRDGVVTLTGEVQWDHQRRNAERAVERVKGVASVDNRLTLFRRPSADDTRERIRNALVRNAIIDANAIEVETTGTTVILRGTVRSWLEKAQASRTAWRSPHVTEVDNRIVVEAD